MWIAETGHGAFESDTLKGLASDIAECYSERELPGLNIESILDWENNQEATQQELHAFQSEVENLIEGCDEAAREERDYRNETQPNSYM